MKPVECQFEADVLAAVLESRWPERAGAEMRAHVSACPICSDVALVAGAVEDARDEMRASAAIPDSGRVWWLARMRAQREAAEAAGRPITAAQMIALACAAGLLGACFGATSAWFQAALRWMASSVAGFDAKAFALPATALLAEHGALACGMAAALVLISAAVGFAVRRD
jgi:hypothetical protein